MQLKLKACNEMMIVKTMCKHRTYWLSLIWETPWRTWSNSGWARKVPEVCTSTYEKWTCINMSWQLMGVWETYSNGSAERWQLLNNPRFAVSYSFHYSSKLFQVTNPNSLINYYMRLTLILGSPRNKLVYTSSYYQLSSCIITCSVCYALFVCNSRKEMLSRYRKKFKEFFVITLNILGYNSAH